MLKNMEPHPIHDNFTYIAISKPSKRFIMVVKVWFATAKTKVVITAIFDQNAPSASTLVWLILMANEDKCPYESCAKRLNTEHASNILLGVKIIWGSKIQTFMGKHFGRT